MTRHVLIMYSNDTEELLDIQCASFLESVKDDVINSTDYSMLVSHSLEHLHFLLPLMKITSLSVTYGT